MTDENAALRLVLLRINSERECEVGAHLPDFGGHSHGLVKHFLIFTCPQCKARGCLAACRLVAERVARSPVWVLQCSECSHVGSRYIFKTEVRGI